jgi:hypothetical protein
VKLPFVTRARMDRELDAVRATALAHAEQAAARHARKLAEAAAANQRLDGRNRELSRRLDSAHDQELGELGDITLLEARAVRADARVRRLLRVIARGGDALRTSRRRADRLQSRLDDACGLNSAAIEARRITQAHPVKEPS